MSKNSNRGFQRRHENRKATEAEIAHAEAIEKAKAQGQAFASSLQYRAVVQQIIGEVKALLNLLPKRGAEPEKEQLKAQLLKLERRLRGAHAFAVECGLQLVNDIPNNPADTSRIVVPTAPEIVVP